MKRKIERKKGMALSQIIILLLGTIAIAYALGEGMGEVSAINGDDCHSLNGECITSAGCSTAGGISQGKSDCSGEDMFCCVLPTTAPSAPTTPTPPSSTQTPAPGISPVLGMVFDAAGKLVPKPTVPGTPVTPTPVAPGDTSILGLITLHGPLGVVVGGVLQIAANAGIAFGLYQLSRWGLSALFPNWDTSLVDILSSGLGIGYFVGSSVVTIATTIASLAGVTAASAGSLGIFFGPLGPLIGGAIGAVVGALIAFLTYKKQMQEVYIFNCYSWMPAGGSAGICRQCGQNGLPCSNYECQSLGQGCKYLNENTELATCDYVSANDVNPPEISPWNSALLEGYAYNPTTAISPPDRGVKVVNSGAGDGCTDYYTPISFGVSLDKPAQCKYSLDKRETSYENMPDLFFPSSNGLSTYNHSIMLSIPDLTGEEGTVPVSESGEHELFVRCKSENQVTNSENFVFKFCISSQPDTSAPEIILTNPLNGFPITSGAISTNVNVWLLEPSQCKWSHTRGQTYDTMAGTMTCLTTADNNMLYKCSGTLDGLTSGTSKFYFKCKDTSPLQNVMTTDYEYTLLGTQPLVIDSVEPTGIQKGSSTAVQVTLEARTSAGYNQGAANCFYNRRCWSNTGSAESYTLFSYPPESQAFSTYSHSQNLFLSAGSYTCSIKCIDLGGNTDIKTTTYSVEVDKNAPVVARAYNEDNLLKLVTNEPAECVYDVLDCNYNFGDGTAMTDSEDELSHTTSWNTRNNLYVKCKDKYNNQPASGCSIILRATNII
ncbi:MAG: hypothetical protein Q7S06_01230 [Nanoarchaeota archaeon]|nr:hypothetical protein [Nanoarchaeota archaeon]